MRSTRYEERAMRTGGASHRTSPVTRCLLGRICIAVALLATASACGGGGADTADDAPSPSVEADPETTAEASTTTSEPSVPVLDTPTMLDLLLRPEEVGEGDLGVADGSPSADGEAAWSTGDSNDPCGEHLSDVLSAPGGGTPVTITVEPPAFDLSNPDEAAWDLLQRSWAQTIVQSSTLSGQQLLDNDRRFLDECQTFQGTTLGLDVVTATVTEYETGLGDGTVAYAVDGALGEVPLVLVVSAYGNLRVVFYNGALSGDVDAAIDLLAERAAAGLAKIDAAL